MEINGAPNQPVRILELLLIMAAAVVVVVGA
jgi:hypothetical protein